MEGEELRRLILTSDVPLVFKDVIKTKLETWSLSQWNQLFKDQKLKFRCGPNKFDKKPQYETCTEVREGTFQDFIKHTESDSTDWWYFDYKYLKQLAYLKEVHENINWQNLGLDDVESEDGVIWIGSKGAHTCCHKDTYGCNVVYQIYGRKQWVLFPPDENLKPTRVPYEESSVYSRLNFFSPLPDEFPDKRSCHKIILNPGDVLLVPHKWWHYVENLETAISVNNWIPLEQDDYERVKEAIVKIIFSTMTLDISDIYKKCIINPNMMKSMDCWTNLMTIIDDNITDPDSSLRRAEEPTKVDAILCKYSKFISKVPRISKEEFRKFLSSQNNRFDNIEDMYDDCDYRPIELELSDLMDAFADDEVLNLVIKKLLQMYRA